MLQHSSIHSQQHAPQTVLCLSVMTLSCMTQDFRFRITKTIGECMKNLLNSVYDHLFEDNEYTLSHMLL